MGDLVPNQLFVAGYSRSKITCDRDIKEIFKKFGQIKDVAYKGTYSFVTFSSEGEAQEALKQLNNQVFNGQKLKVDIVDNRKGRRSGPSETDECFKCGKGGHWARDCPNRSRSPRRRRYSNSRSRYKNKQKDRHRRRRRSDSHSYSSYSSSRSRKRRHQRKRRYSRSRTPPRRDKRSRSPKRRTPSVSSRSKSSISARKGRSNKSSSISK